MADVIGYEEKRPETMAKISSGYPRFVTHEYLRAIDAEWSRRFGLNERAFFFPSSERAAKELRNYCGGGDLLSHGGITGVHLPRDAPQAAGARAFLQHTGALLSSRRAEDYLCAEGLLVERQAEDLAAAETADATVITILAKAFQAPAADVALTCSGMNAFYRVFQATAEIQKQHGRDRWVQLGWLYVDTIEILRKFTGEAENRVFLDNEFDLHALDRILAEEGNKIAGIVTEVATNPLIRAPDLPRLAEIARRHDIPLIVDPTLASPINVNILPHCDVAINSLTKYAASEGDVMMGAAVFNSTSHWGRKLRDAAMPLFEAPYSRDARRLAAQMEYYPAVVEKMNANTSRVARFLEEHPAVKKVFWAYEPSTAQNYRAIHRAENSPGCMISMELKFPLAKFFDRVALAKGPSFGMKFTILCPFLYLAHYDLVSNNSGRRQLRAHGIDPDLVRISIGTEDSAEIIAALAEALG